MIRGRIRVIAVPATAGNVAYTALTPAAGKRWYTLGFYLTLVNDATVANRTVFAYREVTAGTLRLCSARYTGSLAASVTGYWSLGGRSGMTTGASRDGYVHEHDPQVETLGYGERWYIGVANGVAGDSYSGRIVILEVDD